MQLTPSQSHAFTVDAGMTFEDGLWAYHDGALILFNQDRRKAASVSIILANFPGAQPQQAVIEPGRTFQWIATGYLAQQGLLEFDPFDEGQAASAFFGAALTVEADRPVCALGPDIYRPTGEAAATRRAAYKAGWWPNFTMGIPFFAEDLPAQKKRLAFVYAIHWHNFDLIWKEGWDTLLTLVNSGGESLAECDFRTFGGNNFYADPGCGHEDRGDVRLSRLIAANSALSTSLKDIVKASDIQPHRAEGVVDLTLGKEGSWAASMQVVSRALTSGVVCGSQQ